MKVNTLAFDKQIITANAGSRVQQDETSKLQFIIMRSRVQVSDPLLFRNEVLSKIKHLIFFYRVYSVGFSASVSDKNAFAADLILSTTLDCILTGISIIAFAVRIASFVRPFFS